MTDEINNQQDIIDSRDVIARIEELEDERDDLVVRLKELRDERDNTSPDEVGSSGAYKRDEIQAMLDDARAEWEEWKCSHQAEELKQLREVTNQASGYAADWEHGEALIRDSYFQEYAKELAEDCGMIAHDVVWPYTCVDWEQAADDLKQDYTEVDFDGVTYWIR